jgi:hypothetical protein
MPSWSVSRLFQRAAIALGRSRPDCDRANDNRNDPEHEHNCEINGHERPPCVVLPYTTRDTPTQE